VEEGVFLEADVDEHGFEAVLDVFDAAFEDAVDDVAITLALDGIFLEAAILQEGDAALEALGVDDKFVASLLGDAKHAFDSFDHENAARRLPLLAAAAAFDRRRSAEGLVGLFG
jgi:hypothetical protein